jgi:protein SCO1/2
MHPARKYLAIALLFTAFSGGAFFLYLAVSGNRGEPVAATVLPEPRPLPAFSLLDQHGRPFARDSLTGHDSLLFFGFTHCPDICPATLQQLAIARQRVVADGANFPDIVLISVDPARDTPDVMAEYVGHFGAGITGVTGRAEDIAGFARALGIFFAIAGDDDENYNVDHSAAVLLINANADWQAVFSAPHEVDDFVHDVPLLTDST